MIMQINHHLKSKNKVIPSKSQVKNHNQNQCFFVLIIGNKRVTQNPQVSTDGTDTY